MAVPVDRTVQQLNNLGARYSPQTVRDIQADAERRLEHHSQCRKERLKEQFEIPEASKKVMIFQISDHFEREQNCKNVIIDMGLQQGTLIHAVDTPYVAPVAGDPANGVAAVAEVQETYTTHDWFDLDHEFTQDEVEAHCRIMNRHPDEEYPVSNHLSMVIVLNNCKRELRAKIEAQLAVARARDEQCVGGALALYFARRAVVQASQEYSEQLVENLKHFKMSDVTNENAEQVCRILRHSYAILTAANQLPQNTNKRTLDILGTSSVPEFNKVFETWKSQSLITNRYPAVNDIFERAIDIYTSMSRRNKWTPTKPPKSGFHAGTPNHGNGGQDDKQGESQTQGKPERNPRSRTRLSKAEKKAKKNKQKKGNGTSANVAQGPPVGSPGIERMRTFAIDGVQVKGDVSPPLKSEQHLSRKFEKVDGSGFIELWWCWRCGNRGGMWKKHVTYDCPHGRTSTPDNTGSDSQPSSERSVQFRNPPVESAGMARVQPPVTRSLE